MAFLVHLSNRINLRTLSGYRSEEGMLQRDSTPFFSKSARSLPLPHTHTHTIKNIITSCWSDVYSPKKHGKRPPYCASPQQLRQLNRAASSRRGVASVLGDSGTKPMRSLVATGFHRRPTSSFSTQTAGFTQGVEVLLLRRGSGGDGKNKSSSFLLLFLL